MKILIIPDKFKGSLNSAEVCNAIEKGIINIHPQFRTTKIPLADGGEGSLQVLENTLKYERINLKVKNPLFQNINVFYGMIKNTAFIEMASASGLQLLSKNEQNPMFTSSFGTGELIIDAIKKGAKKIYLFVGGSATNDAAIGIASALGYKFLDKNKDEISPIGKNLNLIKTIDLSQRIKFSDIEFVVLTDVKNKLYGKNGAAYSFAKQKGANESEIAFLDKGLQNISKIINSTFGIEIANIEGSGAAGGVAGGMIAFCDAKIASGIDTIMDLLNIDSQISQSDLVITGEGLLDKQTLNGKLIKGVSDRCKKLDKTLAIICGENKLSKDELKTLNPNLLNTIMEKGISKEDSIKNTFQHLVNCSEEVITEFLQKMD